MKRIFFSDQAKADLRAIPQRTAMNILRAIHHLAESGTGRVKTLQGQEGDKRLRVGDYRVRFTEESGESPRPPINRALRFRIRRLRLPGTREVPPSNFVVCQE